MEFAHVCLTVADLDRSVAFYVDQLGFTELDAPGDDRFVSAENDIAIQLRAGNPGASRERLDHLACVVDDVDDAVERIEHHGLVQAPADQPAAGARTAFIEDPDRNHVELIEF